MMKVRAKTNLVEVRDVTAGKLYLVVGLNDQYYRVIDDVGEPILYPRTMFDLVEGEVPSDWVWERYGDDEFYADPPELCGRGFYEDFFDRKPEAQRVFQAYLDRLQAAESRDT